MRYFRLIDGQIRRYSHHESVCDLKITQRAGRRQQAVMIWNDRNCSAPRTYTDRGSSCPAPRELWVRNAVYHTLNSRSLPRGQQANGLPASSVRFPFGRVD